MVTQQWEPRYATGSVSPAANTSLNSRCSSTGTSSSKPASKDPPGRHQCSRSRVDGWSPRSSNSCSVQWMPRSRQPQRRRNPSRAVVALRSGAILCEVKGLPRPHRMLVSSQVTGPQCGPLRLPCPRCPDVIMQQPCTHSRRGASSSSRTASAAAAGGVPIGSACVYLLRLRHESLAAMCSNKHCNAMICTHGCSSNDLQMPKVGRC
jgi:hypothetical protein